MVVVNDMNKVRRLLFGVTIVVVAISTTLLLRQVHKSLLSKDSLPLPTPSVQEAELVEYRVGRVIRSSNEPHEVTVIISLEPRRFTRDDMIKLTHQLKRDFADERILRVEILDDPQIADNYIPAGDMYRFFNKAKRGTYVLNRAKGVEYIEFSTAHGKPIDEIKIDLAEPK
jgi:hypothetical protein